MALERSCPRRPSAGVAYDLEVLVTDVARAVGIFVVTNLDDLVVLSLFFGRAAPTPGRWRQVVAGQYLGIAAIVTLALVGALGATPSCPTAGRPTSGWCHWFSASARRCGRCVPIGTDQMPARSELQHRACCSWPR